MARATPCAKHFSSFSGAIRTKKGRTLRMNPKSYLKFERAVSYTANFKFVRRNRLRLTMAKIEKMPRVAISA